MVPLAQADVFRVKCHIFLFGQPREIKHLVIDDLIFIGQHSILNALSYGGVK